MTHKKEKRSENRRTVKLGKIDLRNLADRTSPDRAFLSIYLSGPPALKEMEKRIDGIEKMLKEERHRDEYNHFRENTRLVRDYFHEHPYKSGSLCLFCCWLTDYFEAYPLGDVPVPDLVHIDSSPFVRPLAELKDEYENFAVVAADNKTARIFLVSSAKAETDSEEEIKGNIKNHVKVGGWSQQRYERRRDKEMRHYTREVVEQLRELNQNRAFRRIIMVGSKETVMEIKRALPKELLDQLAGDKALDLRKGEDFLNREIFDLFFDAERKSERDLWGKIRHNYLRGELAAVGVYDVLAAAKAGRIERIIVNRNSQIEGRRCRECEGLFAAVSEENGCPGCGADDLFRVDMINEIVELLAQTGAETEFCDRIEGLEKVGNIAALLRY